MSTSPQWGSPQPSGDPWQIPQTPAPYSGQIPPAPRYDEGRYGQRPYGEGRYGQRPYGEPMPAYADWKLRVAANLIDFSGPYIVAGVLVSTRALAFGYVLELAAIVWGFYNSYQAGVTGQSTGKRIVGTRLIDERTGGVIGGATGIGRYFLHILDAIPFWLGFLWPLWDAKRQTWADKMVRSVVVRV